MTFWFLMGAALLSLVGAGFHGVLGHRVYMGGINASALAPLSKSLSLVSWHMFTIFLLVCTGVLAFAAVAPAAAPMDTAAMAPMVWPLIAVNALGAGLFIGLALSAPHRHLLRMPGAWLMGGTALLAWLGVG